VFTLLAAGVKLRFASLLLFLSLWFMFLLLMLMMLLFLTILLAFSFPTLPSPRYTTLSFILLVHNIVWIPIYCSLLYRIELVKVAG
jgi:hypothetical protein